jgi:hypothetical protein
VAVAVVLAHQDQMVYLQALVATELLAELLASQLFTEQAAAVVSTTRLA